MEEVRGRFLQLFQEFRGEEKISLLYQLFPPQINHFFIVELANIKMFNLQRKFTHFPVP